MCDVYVYVCLITLTVNSGNKLFLIFNLNHHWYNLRLFPCTISHRMPELSAVTSLLEAALVSLVPWPCVWAGCTAWGQHPQLCMEHAVASTSLFWQSLPFWGWMES